MVAGSGLPVGGAVVCDPVGATEPLGVADGLTDGDRDGDGVRDGLGAVRVGLGDQVGVGLGWAFDGLVSAFSDTGIGRTR